MISRTFSIVGSRIGSLLGLWGTYFVLQMVLMFLIFGMIGASALSGGFADNPLAMGAGVIGMMILFYIIYLLISLASTASLVHNASPAINPTFGDSFGAGLRAIPGLVLLLLLMIVAYIGAIIVLAIVGAIFSALGDAGTVLFGLLVLVGAVYLSCRLSVMFPVIVVEGVTNPITAIQRSWRLTAGNVLRIFLVLLAFSVLVVVIIFLLFALMGGSMMGLGGMAASGGAGSVGAMGAGFLLIMLVFVILGALMAIVMASFMACLHAALAGPEAVAETFQ
ncbi:MAG: glycerophosphoryl diester phosphodiesterase membrane domain-containing protein [Erythrobacter sp.]|nr:glycerophosphoryl diester phosphodiesterase membrane domain-containing protein [Erythrobacter sp.]